MSGGVWAVSLTRRAFTPDRMTRINLLYGIAKGSFHETVPITSAENTVKQCDGCVGSMVTNHCDGGESSMVVTTLDDAFSEHSR